MKIVVVPCSPLLVELPQTRLRIFIISVIHLNLESKKKQTSEVSSGVSQWFMYLLLYWLPDFYSLNFSNIILSIGQYTASGCSTSLPVLPLYSPCRDLLSMRRRMEFAFPRKCCTLSIYQHLIENINMNLHIFLNLIM